MSWKEVKGSRMVTTFMKVWHQYCNHLDISHSLNSPSRFLCCWHQYCNCLNRSHFFDAPSRFPCCNSWHTAYSRVAFMIGSASRAAKMAIQMLATRAPHYPSQTTTTIQHIYSWLPVLRFCLHPIGASQRYPALSFKFNLGSRGGRSFMLPSKSWLLNMKILFPLFNLPSAVSKSLEVNLLDSKRNNIRINNKKLQQNFLVMKAFDRPYRSTRVTFHNNPATLSFSLT